MCDASSKLNTHLDGGWSWGWRSLFFFFFSCNIWLRKYSWGWHITRSIRGRMRLLSNCWQLKSAFFCNLFLKSHGCVPVWTHGLTPFVSSSTHVCLVSCDMYVRHRHVWQRIKGSSVWQRMWVIVLYWSRGMGNIPSLVLPADNDLLSASSGPAHTKIRWCWGTEHRVLGGRL